MVDDKTTSAPGGIRRMGQERWKYLDMANLCFASGEYGRTRGYIEAFLETVDENTEVGKRFKTEFDRIELDRRSNHNKLEKDIEPLGYLEQRDLRERGREQIEIDAIYEQKTVCWTLSLQHGLFNA